MSRNFRWKRRKAEVGEEKEEEEAALSKGPSDRLVLEA